MQGLSLIHIYTDMGKCRMCVAGPRNFVDDESRALRVATKFVNIARAHYESIGRDIDIIKLNEMCIRDRYLPGNNFYGGNLGQYRIILSADTASEVRQMPSQKRR